MNTSNPLKEQTLALAGVAQAARIVDQLSRTGTYPVEYLEASLHSLFSFDAEDVEQLRRVFPGSAELLGARRPSLFCPSSHADAAPLFRGGSGSRLGSFNFNLLVGKESISQMHYAVRRLLKIICSNLKGTILFIDDLQWSDTATLDLLKSIVLDGEIPNLFVVGAYREDEVPE